MRSLLAVAALVMGLLLQTPQPAIASDGAASVDDTARFLAGMQPSANSPLAALTRSPQWQQHAKHFDSEWAALDSRQLSKVRAWSAKNLTTPSQTLFYMFSGPDYLYANAFFPSATTYVMSGLEHPGPIPDLQKLRGNAVPAALGHLKELLRQMLSHSYFITSEMGSHLSRGQLNGTLPLIYVFLARSGKTVREVSHVQLEPDGSVKPLAEGAGGNSARAVKIVFSAGPEGRPQTLYYFSTNLANDGVAKSGFLKFCDQLGAGDSFVKSASYLLHNNGFSQVREFLLNRSVQVLQDDTGIPLSFYKDDTWTLQPYGHYTRPIPVFNGNYQPRMTSLFSKGKPGALDFGIGYRWRVNQSNLVVASKKPRNASARP